MTQLADNQINTDLCGKTAHLRHDSSDCFVGS